jgi:hypothetical protein
MHRPDTVIDHTDCDDGNASESTPAREDWYDGTDANCDGNDWDADGDGYDTDDYTAVHPGDDCDDGNAAINPDASEILSTPSTRTATAACSSDYDASGTNRRHTKYIGNPAARIASIGSVLDPAKPDRSRRPRP